MGEKDENLVSREMFWVGGIHTRMGETVFVSLIEFRTDQSIYYIIENMINKTFFHDHQIPN